MANFLQKAFQRVFGQTEKQPKIDNKKPVIHWSENIRFGNVETPALDEKAQLQQYKSWMYACIKKIATEVADINLFLYKKDANGENIEVEGSQAMDTLYAANESMTFFDLIEFTETYLHLVGECFWWVIKDNKSVPIRIYPYFKPYLMDVVVGDNDTFVSGYVYTNPGTNEKIPFTTDEVIMQKFTNPNRVYRGLSPIKAADYAIATDKKAIDYNYNFLKNNGTPEGVLQTNNTLNEEEYKRLVREWESRHGGAGNAGKIAVLEGGLEYKSISSGLKDLQFIESRRFTRDEILAIFNIPKAVLGIVEDVNRSNAEASIALFKSQVILPLMKKLVNTLNEYYLPMFDKTDELFFDFDNPVPANQEMELAYYNSGLNPANPWLSVNEVRQMEGLDPIDGGDIVAPSQQSITMPEDTDGLKIAKRKKYIKHNVFKKRRTKKQRVKEALMTEDNQKIMQKLITEDAAKRKQRSRENIWWTKIMKTNVDEKKMSSKMSSEFTRQQKQVLDTLKIDKRLKAKVSFNFDTADETKIFVEIFSPEIEAIVKKYGEAALRELGLRGFDVSESIRKKIKSMTTKFSKEINQVTSQKLSDTLNEGVELGESYDKLTKRVMTVFDEATKSRAATIARTEVTKSSNYGMREAWEESGVVTGKEWLVASAEPCDFCGSAKESLDGKVVKLTDNFFNKGDTVISDDGKQMQLNYDNVSEPPLHPNCRCTILPVVSEKRELITMRRNLLSAKKELEKTKKEAKDVTKDLSDLIGDFDEIK